MKPDDLFYQPQLFMGADGYTVEVIKPQEAYPLILNRHYAKRIPSITYAYGLFDGTEMVGVVCYGTPASSTLCRGICGDDWQASVLELNRLVLVYNRKNEASRLVGGSMRLLPKPRIIVSFADTSQHHLGVVYQATNFLYTGLSAMFLDPKVKGMEHLHHATYAHGMTNAEVIEKYGEDNVYFQERARKHRYIRFVGDKPQVAAMRSALKYEIKPYPKKEESNEQA